jgi:hypothetical protein
MFFGSRCGIAAILVIGHGVGASAGEICVACSEPAASYRCGFEGEAAAPASGPGFQLLCIKELAMRGGHKSCTIDRARASGPCVGTLVALPNPADGVAPAVMTPPTAAAGSAAVPVPEAAAVPITEPTVAPAHVKDQPPATVEAMAKASVEQSKKDWTKANTTVKETTVEAGQDLNKAGNAVGKAVTKSWNCVVSLFSSC